MKGVGDDNKIYLSNIKITKQLGEGSFGEVFLGEWRSDTVALKISKEKDIISFEKEIAILQ